MVLDASVESLEIRSRAFLIAYNTLQLCLPDEAWISDNSTQFVEYNDTQNETVSVEEELWLKINTLKLTRENLARRSRGIC